ncbi:MAG: DUF3450 domain-containing protein [Deltaproteobacteria bacterium]|nr:DUF3450 domain-containing protein [Deltaproteobacteria bacterium]
MISFRATAIGIATAAICLMPLAVSAQQLDKPIELREEANATGQASQKRVEEISSVTDGLTAEFRLTNKKIESLNIFNRQLSAVIDSQNEELASLQRQIDDVEEVGRAVTPLMLKMVDALDQFVVLDMPFLPDERKRRVDQLRILMRRSDVADAERYRRILEAYQVENDYGRTIEAYPGTIDKSGAEVPVDYLRVGRIGLMYQTRDGAEVGVWNKAEKAFEPVAGYENWMSDALRVAKKQAAPQLIRIPLPQPEKGGSN